MDRLLVILDLDETLVHATERPLPRPPDFVATRYLVYVRPHLAEFLDGLRREHQVAVWTSAGREYAESVVSTIIPWKAELAFFWCEDRCTPTFDPETREPGVVKTLHKVRRRGYDLRRVLAVDDSPEKHVRSYGNLVPVRPYLGDPDDAELPALLRYLHTLAAVPDVRSVEKRLWRDTGTG